MYTYIHIHIYILLYIYTYGWWFGTFFKKLYIGNNNPIRGVGTTNQILYIYCNTFIKFTWGSRLCVIRIELNHVKALHPFFTPRIYWGWCTFPDSIGSPSVSQPDLFTG